MTLVLAPAGSPAGSMDRWRLPAQAVPYVSSCVSACLATCCVHPIETIKTRLQVARVEVPWMKGEPSVRLSAMTMARGVLSREGVPGLFVGIRAALLRQATYGTARLGLYRQWETSLRRSNGGAPLPYSQKLCLSGAAGACGVLVGNPFDVALVRFQSDTLRPVAERRNYTSLGNALRRIAAEDGPVTFYRGCSVSMVRAIGMNCSMMATYDQARESAARVSWMDDRQAAFGAKLLSGVCCAVVTAPMDMVKSRLQNMARGSAGSMYSGPLDAVIQTVRCEGLLGLWTGIIPYTCRCAPHAVLVLALLDVMEPLVRAGSNAA
eukprot:TRINITY_DN71569_c0_g1_i1.p2 TRINITY_DN71569_c0_g1~~TRINITY_DN71569_c0_g1_i1.p2  ORF type:complete len:322 (+),score=41.60 TRINITY_DN71569_c0_g1_i1:89-1054(+)